MAAIQLQNLSKAFYSHITAVRELNLDIADGELIVLVGPSGCGKTTTLRMIAGLESPTTGTIRIGERIVNDVEPHERRVAMVFQDSALYPHMTARGNLTFKLRMHRTARHEIDHRVETIAAMVGITDLLDRKPSQLSGGQNQRVALARALMQNPDVLLLDEPLSNLDSQLRSRLRTEIKSLQRGSHITTIHVTHDQEEAMALADRLVVMANGQVQQIGAPMEVYRKPANRFVAGFLGNPQMNFIDGSLELTGDRLCFAAKASRTFRLPLEKARFANDVTAQPVTLGIRPEHLVRCADREHEGGTIISATVRHLETLGDRCLLHVELDDGTALVIREMNCTQSQSLVSIGQQIRVRVDVAASHVFEAGEFGARLG